MNPDDVRIVRITNIAPFDFTPDMGARFGGRDYPLRKGESKLYPFTLGDHLATHLARQIVLKKAPVRTESEMDGKGSTIALWDDAGLAALKATIIKDVYSEEKQPQQSESDRMAAKVDQLNTDPEIAALLPHDDANLTDSKDGGLDASALGISGSGSPQTIDVTFKTKADIIAQLQTKGVTFNPRDSKDALSALLGAQT